MTAPSAAIVGMAAMVGAGTGGVMTAIVMVFEMTRDYAIIVPVIVAVAVAAGIRRALIGETIYTIKLRHRGHRIPKERHINLYLVKQAQDIMERRFIVAKAGTSLKDTISAEDTDDLRAIIVEREGRIVGLIPPRSGLWRESQSNPDLLVERFVESPRGDLPGRRSPQPGVRQTKAPSLRRGHRLPGRRAAEGPRHRRRHHQTRDRRHGHRQLRRLIRGGISNSQAERRGIASMKTTSDQLLATPWVSTRLKAWISILQ